MKMPVSVRTQDAKLASQAWFPFRSHCSFPAHLHFISLASATLLLCRTNCYMMLSYQRFFKWIFNDVWFLDVVHNRLKPV